MTRRRRGYVSWVTVLPTGVATTVDAGWGEPEAAEDFEELVVFDREAAATDA